MNNTYDINYQNAILNVTAPKTDKIRTIRTKDKFGTVPGTQASRINELVETGLFTIKEISNIIRAEYNPEKNMESRVRSHLNSLQKIEKYQFKIEISDKKVSFKHILSVTDEI